MADLSFDERRYVLERIRSEVKGRMLEDMVLLETKLSHPELRVFALQFAVGEFDMVTFEPHEGGCRIYEIKHSCKRVSEQRRHLLDPEKRRLTEHRFGEIAGAYVIYRGEDAEEEGVRYCNVERYLREVGQLEAWSVDGNH